MSMVKIRPARIEDANRIENFLLRIEEFAGTIQPGQESKVWRWLFVCENEAPSAFVAEANATEIVGHYGFCKMTYLAYGQTVEAGMICKLAIDKNYRKSTAFLQLTMAVMKAYQKQGLGFLQGLANRSGLLSFHLAFGFKKIGSVPVFAKPIHFAPMAKAMFPGLIGQILAPLANLAQVIYRALEAIWFFGAHDSNFSFELVREFPTSLNSPLAQRQSEFKISALRNARVLNWRFARSDFRDYLIYLVKENGVPSGYFVLRNMPMKNFNVLAITDILFDFKKKRLAQAVFQYISNKAVAEKADMLAILASGEQLQSCLKKAWFLKTPESFDFVIHEKQNSLSTSSIKDWFLTWFDHDHV